MTIPENILRRVKTNIRARTHSFFGIYTPGFEDIGEKELLELGITEITSKEKGGILFNAKIDNIYTLNLSSLTATRFLMRIDSFKATNFSKLSKRIENIPWELYLNPDEKIDFTISSSKSRLYHSDAVKQTVEKALNERMKSYYPSYSPVNGGLKLFIRINDDKVTISIDSSGESLYLRGYKKEVSDAPIRENIASAIIKNYDLSNFDEIIDPMCGTGTFIFETLLQLGYTNHYNLRHYSFEKWPVFSETSFNYIKSKLAEKESTLNIKLTGSDISSKNIESAIKNKSNLVIKADETSINFTTSDFFKLKNTSKRLLILLNPPYGKRVTAGDSTFELYKKIGIKLKKDFKGAELAIIVPGVEIEKALGLKYTTKIPFMNGGLPVAVLFITI